jgi:hypothetical protein
VVSVRFYTEQECQEWLKVRQRSKPERSTVPFVETIPYPDKPYEVFQIARWVSGSLTYRMPSLLWITECGIWPSSENWHLYYKVRQSYSEPRLITEAPGHLFLDYETEDLATFLQLAILNGWDGLLLTEADYVNIIFSHDEYIQFLAKEETQLLEVRQVLRTAEK